MSSISTAAEQTDHDSQPDGGGHPAAALGLLVATYTAAAAALVLVFINRPEWHVGQWYFLVDLSDAFVFGIVGWVLLSRTRHPVAWIISGCALGGAVAAVAMQWTELWLRQPDVPEWALLQPPRVGRGYPGHLR